MSFLNENRFAVVRSYRLLACMHPVIYILCLHAVVLVFPHVILLSSTTVCSSICCRKIAKSRVHAKDEISCIFSES